MFVGGDEVLLQENLKFAQRVSSVGGAVQVEVFEGMWHDFIEHTEGCGCSQAGTTVWRSSIYLMLVSSTSSAVSLMLLSMSTCLPLHSSDCLMLALGIGILVLLESSMRDSGSVLFALTLS